MFLRPLRRRGNRKNMEVPRMRTNKGRASIAYRGPYHWNGLKNELKEIEMYESFRRGYSKEISGKFENHPT